MKKGKKVNIQITINSWAGINKTQEETWNNNYKINKSKKWSQTEIIRLCNSLTEKWKPFNLLKKIQRREPTLTT
jgi:hypothetical protein